eukprot:Nitzschia sp. Nitz4//scaffold102_size76354//47794//49490//NITZ4_005636-RA/size76354-snap-gene-0.127-mRNA-1//1//CDS//3329532261//9015//frame0
MTVQVDATSDLALPMEADMKTKENGLERQRQLQQVEDVLVVPKRWTKEGYQILLDLNTVPRGWHLEGRWGSRTHKVDNDHMGLPICSAEQVRSAAAEHSGLSDLFSQGGRVEVDQPFVTSKRAREPEYIDSTFHPERKPVTSPSVPDTCPFPRKPDEPTLFTYMELFAGVGGFGVALESLGGSCIFCSELEEYCREVYKANFDTPHHHIHGDIYEVKDEQFPVKGSLDFLVGGFPCQPFSRLNADQPGFDCEKGRGLLFLQIVRALRLSQPRGFLLENVPGLLDLPDACQQIFDSFRDAGYQVTAEVCSSRSLTATMRKRLYIVGIRNDLVATKLDGELDAQIVSSDEFIFPYIPDLQLKAHDILDYDEIPDSELQILRLADTTMNQLLNGGRWRPHALAWPNRPCNVLTSHYGNAVGRGESQLVPCHAPHNPRRFTTREVARIMGFPNSYRQVDPRPNTYTGDMAYRKLYYRMFGNAVCPPIIAALAGSVLDRCHLQSAAAAGIDWVARGREMGIRLAKSSMRQGHVQLPMGCLVLDDC